MRGAPAPHLALARVEGRRLLRHPAFVVAALLGLQLLLLDDAGGDFLEYKVLVGAGLAPMAVGAGVAAGLAASRARRDRTEELYLSLPSPPASRAAGQLLAVGWAAAAGAAVTAALAVALGAWGGLPTPSGAPPGPDEITPGLAALAQGPALVALVGATGVALGGGQSVLAVQGVDAAAMGWHILYLAGLGLVVAAVALGRRGRPASARLAVTGLVGAATGGLLQIVTAR